MSVIYLMALVAVGLAVVAALFEAVGAVSRQPQWESVQFARPVALSVVETEERRTQKLPFVGQDRRKVNAGHAEQATPARKAA